MDMSLGTLWPDEVSECPHLPTAASILQILTCKLEFDYLVFNHASVFKQN